MRNYFTVFIRFYDMQECHVCSVQCDVKWGIWISCNVMKRASKERKKVSIEREVGMREWKAHFAVEDIASVSTFDFSSMSSRRNALDLLWSQQVVRDRGDWKSSVIRYALWVSPSFSTRTAK